MNHIEELRDIDVELRTWVPKDSDGDPHEKFQSLVNDDTCLVITDYDLTTSFKGLFGLSIVGWCQAQSIPVGDFSRGNQGSLPAEPDLFEMRVPANNEQGSRFVVETFNGFITLEDRIRSRLADLNDKKSLAAVLATILDRTYLESQFGLYMSRLVGANSAILEKLRDAQSSKNSKDEEKVKILTYLLGHILPNAILKFPGPILSAEALCAYVACSVSEAEALVTLFGDASYNGPFSKYSNYFWRDQIDEMLEQMLSELPDQEFDSTAEYYRFAISQKLDKELYAHDCGRCGGTRGGYWCPLTNRAVCSRSDCSVPSSSLLPPGARISRVERDFYEEWAPILGL